MRLSCWGLCGVQSRGASGCGRQAATLAPQLLPADTLQARFNSVQCLGWPHQLQQRARNPAQGVARGTRPRFRSPSQRACNLNSCLRQVCTRAQP